MPTEPVYRIWKPALQGFVAIQGMTQHDLADRIRSAKGERGISRSHLNRLINGKERATWDVLARIAEPLGVSVSAFSEHVTPELIAQLQAMLANDEREEPAA